MWTITGHTLGTPDQTPSEAVHLFADAGLDGAEIIWQDGYRSGIPETDNAGVLREVQRACVERGLRVVGLTPYMSGLNALDGDERQRDIARFRDCLADAEMLGARVVRVYAGAYMPEQVADRPRMWDRLVTALSELAPVAEQHGVTLAVENHFNTMTMSARETADLVRDVAHPAVGILYDQANLTFTHCESFPEAVDIQSGLIRHLHAKDLIFVDRDRPFSASSVATVSGDERAVRSCVLGDGEMDWAGILAAVAATGYDGAVSLEYEYRWHPQDLPTPEVGFRRGAEVLRSLIPPTMPEVLR